MAVRISPKKSSVLLKSWWLIFQCFFLLIQFMLGRKRLSRLLYGNLLPMFDKIKSIEAEQQHGPDSRVGSASGKGSEGRSMVRIPAWATILATIKKDLSGLQPPNEFASPVVQKQFFLH